MEKHDTAPVNSIPPTPGAIPLHGLAPGSNWFCLMILRVQSAAPKQPPQKTKKKMPPKNPSSGSRNVNRFHQRALNGVSTHRVPLRSIAPGGQAQLYSAESLGQVRFSVQ